MLPWLTGWRSWTYIRFNQFKVFPKKNQKKKKLFLPDRLELSSTFVNFSVLFEQNWAALAAWTFRIQRCAAGKAHEVTTSHLKSALILFRVELSSCSGDRQTTPAVYVCVCDHTCVPLGRRALVYSAEERVWLSTPAATQRCQMVQGLLWKPS